LGWWCLEGPSFWAPERVTRWGCLVLGCEGESCLGQNFLIVSSAWHSLRIEYLQCVGGRSSVGQQLCPIGGHRSRRVGRFRCPPDFPGGGGYHNFSTLVTKSWCIWELWSKVAKWSLAHPSIPSGPGTPWPSITISWRDKPVMWVISHTHTNILRITRSLLKWTWLSCRHWVVSVCGVN